MSGIITAVAAVLGSSVIAALISNRWNRIRDDLLTLREEHSRFANHHAELYVSAESLVQVLSAQATQGGHLWGYQKDEIRTAQAALVEHIPQLRRAAHSLIALDPTLGENLHLLTEKADAVVSAHRSLNFAPLDPDAEADNRVVASFSNSTIPDYVRDTYASLDELNRRSLEVAVSVSRVRGHLIRGITPRRLPMLVAIVLVGLMVAAAIWRSSETAIVQDQGILWVNEWKDTARWEPLRSEGQAQPPTTNGNRADAPAPPDSPK